MYISMRMSVWRSRVRRNSISVLSLQDRERQDGRESTEIELRRTRERQNVDLVLKNVHDYVIVNAGAGKWWRARQALATTSNGRQRSKLR